MRKALEDAGVEMVSRADDYTQSLQTDNDSLRRELTSLSAWLSAAQQETAFFKGLLVSEEQQKLNALEAVKAALQEAVAERQAKQQAIVSAQVCLVAPVHAPLLLLAW